MHEMRDDLKVWLSFLSDYNGITVMLDDVWTSNETICLLTELFVNNSYHCLIINIKNNSLIF
jgi:hypothetical protein